MGSGFGQDYKICSSKIYPAKVIQLICVAQFLGFNLRHLSIKYVVVPNLLCYGKKWKIG